MSMPSITADSIYLYDALCSSRHDRAVIAALLASLLVHAAAFTLLPRMPTPPASAPSITVKLAPVPPKTLDEQQPPPKRTAQKPEKAEKPFVRRAVEAVAAPVPTPQPVRIDPRNVVAIAPRPEPILERTLAAQPPPVRLEPRPQTTLTPPAPRVERPELVVESAPRPEPTLRPEPDLKPEPRLEGRAEPRVNAVEPRIVPQIERRAQPVAVARDEPIISSRRPDVSTPPAVRPDAAATPRIDAPIAVARVERTPNVKMDSAADTPVPVRQRSSPEPTPMPSSSPSQALPQRLNEPAVPRAASRPPAPPAGEPPVAQPVRPPSAPQVVRSDIAATAPLPSQTPLVEPLPRRQLPVRAPDAPLPGAPPARPTASQTRAAEQTVIPSPSSVPTPEQPRSRTAPQVTAPDRVAALPSAPVRNKGNEERAIHQFAADIARQMGRQVSERDYPRIARERKWQGITQVMLQIAADGKLLEVKVASSSGYEVLDARAVELIKGLSLPAVPADIEHSFSVRIPVRFSLRD
jgi:TonB family protein